MAKRKKRGRKEEHVMFEFLSDLAIVAVPCVSCLMLAMEQMSVNWASLSSTMPG